MDCSCDGAEQQPLVRNTLGLSLLPHSLSSSRLPVRLPHFYLHTFVWLVGFFFFLSFFCLFTYVHSQE